MVVLCLLRIPVEEDGMKKALDVYVQTLLAAMIIFTGVGTIIFYM